MGYLSFAIETELGYDSTMTHVVQGNKEHLIIQVKSWTFVTHKVLADFAADSLLGQGSRVWRGHFEGEDNKERVLKEVWVDTDRPREGNILRDLVHAFQLHPYPNSSFSDHYLTVIEDTIVEVDGTHHDDTLNTMMNGQEPPEG